MRTILLACFILATISGCAYISDNTITLEAKDVNAIVGGGVPVKVGKGDVLAHRSTHVCIFHCKNK